MAASPARSPISAAQCRRAADAVRQRQPPRPAGRRSGGLPQRPPAARRRHRHRAAGGGRRRAGRRFRRRPEQSAGRRRQHRRHADRRSCSPTSRRPRTAATAATSIRASRAATAAIARSTERGERQASRAVIPGAAGRTSQGDGRDGDRRALRARWRCCCSAPSARAEPFVPAADERGPGAPAGRRRRRGARACRPARGAGRRTRRTCGSPCRWPPPMSALGRREADPRFDGYAQAALAPWWQLARPPLPVLILRATLRQRRHDFTAALADLDQALARAPGQPQALLSKATILGVQGKPGQALQACRALAGSVDRLVEAACIAGAKGLGGRAARGLSAARAERSAAARGAEPAIASWALTIHGRARGPARRARRAERHFRAAPRARPGATRICSAPMPIACSTRGGRPRCGAARRGNPDRSLLLRLALAERQLGHPDLDRHVAMLAARFEAARRRGDGVHLREAARFEPGAGGRPDEALALALADFAVQREPADVRMALEAALAAGRARGRGAGAGMAAAHRPRGRPHRGAGARARGSGRMSRAQIALVAALIQTRASAVLVSTSPRIIGWGTASIVWLRPIEERFPTSLRRRTRNRHHGDRRRTGWLPAIGRSTEVSARPAAP